MGPILLLTTTGLTTVAVGAGLNRATLSNPQLKPTIGGVDARKVTTGVGVALLLLGGPVTAAVGAGMAAGSLLTLDTGNLVQKGLDAYIQQRLTTQPAPAQIEQTPAPQVPAAPQAPAAQQPIWGRFMDLFSHPTVPAEASSGW